MSGLDDDTVDQSEGDKVGGGGGGMLKITTELQQKSKQKTP